MQPSRTYIGLVTVTRTTAPKGHTMPSTKSRERKLAADAKPSQSIDELNAETAAALHAQAEAAAPVKTDAPAKPARKPRAPRTPAPAPAPAPESSSTVERSASCPVCQHTFTAPRPV